MGTVSKNMEIFIDGDEGSHLGHNQHKVCLQKVGHLILYEFYKNKVTQKPNHDTRAGLFMAQASPAICAWRGCTFLRAEGIRPWL